MVICVTDMLMITLLPQPNFLWRQHVYLRRRHSDKIIKKKKKHFFFVNMRFHLTTFDLKYVEITLCFCSLDMRRLPFRAVSKTEADIIFFFKQSKKNPKQTLITQACVNTHLSWGFQCDLAFAKARTSPSIMIAIATAGGTKSS